MVDVISNTSPLQYLHLLGGLEWLREFSNSINVPIEVIQELEAGFQDGYDVPQIAKLNWIKIIEPQSSKALPLAVDVGKGEAAVLASGLENSNSLLILDDRKAREIASFLQLRYTGTLGVLLSTKAKGLIRRIAPLLDQLELAGFHLSPTARNAVLGIAGEK